MRRSLAVAATLSMLALTPALAQQATPPVPAQPSPRLMPRGPGTPNSTTAPATVGTARPAAPAATSSAVPAGQLVNINTAAASDLDALPQIGPARAKMVIAGRPYASPQDLLTKHVLSQRVYDMIKDRITVR